jgi:hypothetical protein
MLNINNPLVISILSKMRWFVSPTKYTDGILYPLWHGRTPPTQPRRDPLRVRMRVSPPIFPAFWHFPPLLAAPSRGQRAHPPATALPSPLSPFLPYLHLHFHQFPPFHSTAQFFSTVRTQLSIFLASRPIPRSVTRHHRACAWCGWWQWSGGTGARPPPPPPPPRWKGVPEERSLSGTSRWWRTSR